jgi:hypothetical protein
LLFQHLVDSFESSIVTLITHTDMITDDLRRMEERLSTIRDVASSEARMRLLEKSELLADIWTLFGGHRKHLALLERNLQALRMLYEYHGLADRCVSSAQRELIGMREALEELRPLTSQVLIANSDWSMEAVIEQIMQGGERVRMRQREVVSVRTGNTSHKLLSPTMFDS